MTKNKNFDWMKWARKAGREPFDPAAWVKELQRYGITVHLYEIYDPHETGFFIGLADQTIHSLASEKALALVNVGDSKARRAAVVAYLLERESRT